jgi:hypothetical protein
VAVPRGQVLPQGKDVHLLHLECDPDAFCEHDDSLL